MILHNYYRHITHSQYLSINDYVTHIVSFLVFFAALGFAEIFHRIPFLSFPNSHAYGSPYSYFIILTLSLHHHPNQANHQRQQLSLFCLIFLIFIIIILFAYNPPYTQ